MINNLTHKTLQDKEEMFMKTSAALRQNKTLLIKSMQKYVSELKEDAKKDPSLAKKDAQKVLVRTGVATAKGNLKMVIVSWE